MLPNKASGPDNFTHCVLNLCADQLARILSVIFNLCFQHDLAPMSWKTSHIVPVPKKAVISSMNDLRPVALTSAVMQVCERVVLQIS